MAKRKKRVTAQKRKSARKSSKSVRRTAAKRTARKSKLTRVVAKAKRSGRKKVARKKARPMKPPITQVVETTIVDVVEEPVPGVITVTEFEETDVREAGAGQEPPEES